MFEKMKFSKDKKYEIRIGSSVNNSSEHGRSTVIVTCPYCDTGVLCYTWSLSGGGKICPTCKENKSHVVLGFGMCFRKLTKDELIKL